MSDTKSVSKMGRIAKVFWWVLGTVVAVPITKWVETQLNFSFFSPAISGLWSLLTTFGEWLKRDVSLPIWAVFVLLIITTLGLILILGFLYARFESEQNDDSPLSNEQTFVFLTLGRSIDAGQNVTFSGLSELTNLPRIATHNALDVLSMHQLITGATDNMGYEYIDLTRRGRELYLRLQSGAPATFG